MKAVGQYALIVTSALAAGAVLFIATFAVLDFVWTHFVLSNPKEASPADGMVVIGGGFLLGAFLGGTAFGLVLYRFWPRKRRKYASAQLG
jgi:hypothetical protein